MNKKLGITAVCVAGLLYVWLGLGTYALVQAGNALEAAQTEILRLDNKLKQAEKDRHIELANTDMEVETLKLKISMLEGKVEVIDESINGHEKRKARIEQAIAAIKAILPEGGNPLPGCPKSPSPGELWSIAGAIVDNADEYAVPASLIAAVIRQESAFCNQATSHAGAKGYMQLMPDTAAMVSGDVAVKTGRALRTWRGRDNIQLGTAYLSQMILEFDGSVELAVQAYNAGPTHIKRVLVGERTLYKETSDYVVKVLEYKQEFERLGLL